LGIGVCYVVGLCAPNSSLAFDVVYGNAIQNSQHSNMYWLDLSGVSLSDDMLLVRNITQLDFFTLMTPDIDKMFSASSYRAGGNLYLDLIRRTDYTEIFGAESSYTKFITTARQSGKNMGLLKSLDSALSRGAIVGIIKNSAAYNHKKLLYPLKLSNALDAFGYGALGFDTGLNGNIIFSDNKNIWTIGTNLQIVGTDDFYFGLGLKYGNFSATDYNDQITGNFYNANLMTSVNILGAVGIFARVGAAITDINTDNYMIFNTDGSAAQNPTGYTLYGDFIMDYSLVDYNGFYIKPNISIHYSTDKIVDTKSSEFYAGGGGRIGFYDETGGIKSDYYLSAMARGDIKSFGGGIQIASTADEFSVLLNGGISKFCDDLFYNFGAKLSTNF
jgi:hypothetical protein